MNNHSDLLSYLKNAQLSNGSFENSPFQTSLILICLAKTKKHPLVKTIAQNAIEYLFSQGSLQGSWNYWDRSHAKSQTLPDDLDDTSVAIAAITLYKPDLVNENVLLSFVKNLVSSEMKEGGPYYTWIVPESIRDSWGDVDLVVNGNIGFALHLNNIHLDPLEEFLNSKIAQNRLDSKYYSPLHTCYFLSKWYFHNKKALMKTLCRTYPNIHTNLDRALFVSTYLNLGGDPQKISHELKRLAHIKTPQLSIDPFYVESIEDKIPVYAKSQALTAACILEALSFNDNKPEVYNLSINTVANMITRKFQDSPESIQRQLTKVLDKLKSHTKAPEIFLLPLLWHDALYPKFKKPDSHDQIVELCIANVLGWIGFSIYDDVIDGEKKEVLIPLANLCVRKISSIFNSHQTILDKIDYANNWEQSVCRISITNNVFEIPDKLPNYGTLDQLAHKSLGHALGPMILSPSKENPVQRFFTHYLIARQLNDDAHDWLEDLGQGFLNPVSTKILRKFRDLYPTKTHIDLETDKPVLQSLFWYEVIDTVALEITNHLKQARKIIKKAKLVKNMETIDILLDPLQKSADQALHERDSAIRFIEKYR